MKNFLQKLAPPIRERAARSRLLTIGSITLALLLILVSSRSVHAQTVELQLSQTSLEVGEVIDVPLVCTNIPSPSLPQWRTPDGLKMDLVSSTPSVMQSTSIANGVRTDRTTHTYALRIVGVTPGEYTVGPITVESSGNRYSTATVRLIVQAKSASKGPADSVVFTDIQVSRNSLYVTESITATLRIGLREAEIGGQKINVDLWRQVFDQGASSISVFAGGNAQRTRTSLTDSSGVRHGYEIYRVTQLIRGDQVGILKIGPIFIKANYPVKLANDFFGNTVISQTRRETATAPEVLVEVKAPPTEGRPSDYNGAIGQFSFHIEGKPDHVELGQAVTLAVTIEGSPLEGVPGPDFSSQSDLVSRFDFSTDELTGDVAQGRKVFRRAIFPKQPGAQTIPSLSWSYFDPRTERYETLRSQPIPVVVEAPSQPIPSELQLSGTEQQLKPGAELTRLAGGLAPNYTDPAILLASDHLHFGPTWAAIVAVPPIGYAAIALGLWRAGKLRGNRLLARRRKARARAERILSNVPSGAKSSDQLVIAGSALAQFLSDWYDLPPGAVTPAEIRLALSRNGTDAATVDEIVRFLESCEASRYGSSTSAINERETVDHVRHWIRHFERGRK